MGLQLHYRMIVDGILKLKSEFDSLIQYKKKIAGWVLQCFFSEIISQEIWAEHAQYVH